MRDPDDGFYRSTHQMRESDDGVWRCRMCKLDGRFIGLLTCLEAELGYTTRTIRFGVPDMAAEIKRATYGFPWCGVCNRPSHAVGAGQGLRHDSDDPQFFGYIPKHLDDSGHEVDHTEWFAVHS